jgi:hypothetical protein
MRNLLALISIVSACDQNGVLPFGDARSEGHGGDGAGAGNWAISAGGPGKDLALLALDRKRDEILIAGRFVGVASFGELGATANGAEALYVARLDAGGRFLWVLPVQAQTSSSVGPRLAVDEEGNAYLCAGGFSGHATVGAIGVDAKGPADVLVVKVDPAGKPLWAVSHGGPDSRPIIPSHTQAIAARAGVVAVVGTFDGVIDLGGKRHASQSYDLFVAQLDPVDGRVRWGVRAGGAGVELGFAITLGAAGDSTVGGALHGDASFGSHDLKVPSARELFVARIDAGGTWRWASTSVSRGLAPIDGYVAELALDAEGTIVAAGALYIGFRPLVVGFDPSGNPTWTAVADGASASSWDGARALALERGRVWTAGSFSGARRFGSRALAAQGRDLFLARLDEARGFVDVERAGGLDDDWAGSLAVDAAGNRYLSGFFTGSVTLGRTHLASRGETDLFVWKIPATEP